MNYKNCAEIALYRSLKVITAIKLAYRCFKMVHLNNLIIFLYYFGA